MADVDRRCRVAWGGRYIDDFIDRGRVKHVIVAGRCALSHGAGRLRSLVRAQSAAATWCRRPHLPTRTGPTVRRGWSATTAWRRWTSTVRRRRGELGRGHERDGEAGGAAAARASRSDWTGESYQERAAGSQTPLLYTLSLIVVFLCLAALYESWSIPTAILLAVPLGVIGAVLATAFRGLERDIYFQVAMLTTIGLASKNAILIVEFAKEYVEARQERDRRDAARGARSTSTDPDDLAGVRTGRAAVGGCDRRGRRRAACHRHWGIRRHGGRHVPWNLLHPAVFRDRAAGVPQRAGRGCKRRRQTPRTPADGREYTPWAHRPHRCAGRCLQLRMLCVAAELHHGAALSRAGIAGAAAMADSPHDRACGDTAVAADTAAQAPAEPAQAGTEAARRERAADIGWRDFFADPRLQRLIAQALANNRDLRVAVLNIQLARAQYRVQRSELLPAVSAPAASPRRSCPQSKPDSAYPITGSLYQVGVGCPRSSSICSVACAA